MRSLIAVPVYNEQKHVVPVLKQIQQHAPEADVLVIDDGSTDATPTMLAEVEVDVIRHARNRGYGRSIRDAFRWSQCYAYDWLITMDCDEQHEPGSLPDFLAEARRDRADIISGSRYLNLTDAVGSPPADRRAINARITKMVNERLGLHLTDAFCGFKAYRVQALQKFSLDVDGYALPLQQGVQAAAHDLRVTEIPIRLIYTDEKRSFGGPLDNPDVRMAHYQKVFDRELAKYPCKFGQHGAT